MKLQKAVAAGDFAAVADEKNAFELFQSGAYQANGGKAQATKAVLVEQYGKIMEACASKNKDALKSAYGTYITAADISTILDPAAGGQGYSSDYSWTKGSAKAEIYVR